MCSRICVSLSLIVTGQYSSEPMVSGVFSLKNIKINKTTISFSIFFQHNRQKKGHVETFTLNPKCVKLGELYGETDPNTFEWSDGLIAKATRRFAKEMVTVQGEVDQALRSISQMSQVCFFHK